MSTKLGDCQTLSVAEAGSFLIFRTDQRKAVKLSRTLGFMMLVDIYNADDSKNAVSDRNLLVYLQKRACRYLKKTNSMVILGNHLSYDKKKMLPILEY
jgi:hypothetical protein